MRTLAANRKTTAMPQAAIAAKIHQSLDVHCNFTPQIAFNHKVTVNHFADLQHFRIAQLRHAARFIKFQRVHDFLRFVGADAMNILERDHDALVGRKIDACDTGHDFSPAAGGIGPPILFLKIFPEGPTKG
jgi:hypothetical protein